MRPVSLVVALTVGLLLLVGVGATSANDSVYGGNGSHPMPLTTSDVRMVEEHVVLTYDKARAAWDVSCDFVFENTAATAQTLTVGFPFPTYDPDMGDVTVPKPNAEPKPGQPLVWGFKTLVAGKPVAVRETRTIKNPALPDLDYPFAYLWEASFPPAKKIAIRNTYTHGEHASVDGTMWARYVLKTGGLWKGGAIGRSRLDVIVPTKRVVVCPDFMSHDGPAIKPAGGRLVADANGFAIRWDLKDFAPGADLDVCLVDLDQFAAMHFHELASEDLSKLDKAALRVLRNGVYALHGYTFKSAAMRDHFAKQWWYQPDPTYTAKRLTHDQHRFVARVKAEEAKRK